ncbi:MAG: hypothetical protein QXP58_05070 [Thermoprotei archaeon]
MNEELNRVLRECMMVFEELEDLEVRVCYKPLRKGVLGQTRVKKQLVRSRGKRRFAWRPIIEVSSSLGEVRDPLKKRELLRYVLVHELVHLSRNHLNRPRGKEHEDDFELEVRERLRRLQNIVK